MSQPVCTIYNFKFQMACPQNIHYIHILGTMLLEAFPAFRLFIFGTNVILFGISTASIPQSDSLEVLLVICVWNGFHLSAITAGKLSFNRLRPKNSHSWEKNIYSAQNRRHFDSKILVSNFSIEF